ncbi:MAG: S8 family peptidase [Burkholderiaceae bacterium]|jgi:serine protease|nr:S8 family peptidase [Burkholderiaceae bacterium]
MRSLSLTAAGMLAGSTLAVTLIALPIGAQTLPNPPADPTAPARVARGLIVELKSTGAAASNRQAPQALRDQLASVARTAGLPAPNATVRQVGARGYLLNFAAPLQGAALDAAVQSVTANPAVQSVSPDVRLHRLDTAPNDPEFVNDDQWYLRNSDDPAGGAAALNTPLAWDVTTGLSGPVVAVVDTGALFSHQDLASQFIPGYDLISDVTAGNTGLGRNPDASDPGDWISRSDLRNPDFAGCTVEPSSWHGSFIAGIIGAATNNAIGVAGINWNAQIQPVRVAGKCGSWLSDAVDGLRWAAGGSVDGVPDNPTPARIINVSFGGAEACEPTYQSAIDDAVARGALVVVAAGNSNTALGSPANCSGVLAVGAVRQDGLKTFYSSFGAGISLMAPGGSGEDTLPNDTITSTSNTGTQGPVADTYTQSEGTSFAAPMAVGVASLMLAVNPSLTPAQLIKLLQQSARPFPNNPNYPVCGNTINTACNCTPQTCGAGLLDASAAVQLASGGSLDNGSNSQSANANSSQGGGGAMGWLWGLGLWGLAALALWQRHRAAVQSQQA